MLDYYIEDDVGDIFTYEVRTFELAYYCKLGNESYEEKNEFEIIYYMDECIKNNLGYPPNGSGFDYNCTESYHGKRIYHLVYKYNPLKKAHIKYLNKVFTLMKDKNFKKECKNNFSIAYKNHLN